MNQAFKNILSRISVREINIIVVISIVLTWIIIGHICRKKDQYEYEAFKNTWLLSTISWGIISFTLINYYKLTSFFSDINSLPFKNDRVLSILEPYILKFIKLIISSGCGLLVVMLLIGLLIKFICKILVEKCNSRMEIENSSIQTSIFARIIMLNILVYISYGALEYPLILLSILLGKFIWIGSSLNEIKAEMAYLFGGCNCTGENHTDHMDEVEDTDNRVFLCNVMSMLFFISVSCFTVIIGIIREIL